MDFTRFGFTSLSIACFLEYFQMKQESITIFAILLLIDFALWIIHAYYKDKQSITSTRMRLGAGKKVLRFTIPFSVVIMLKGIGFAEIGFLVSSIMSILIASEGYSILRHYVFIQTKKEMTEMDAIDFVLNKVIDILKNYLTNNTKPNV